MTRSLIAFVVSGVKIWACARITGVLGPQGVAVVFM